MYRSDLGFLFLLYLSLLSHCIGVGSSLLRKANNILILGVMELMNGAKECNLCDEGLKS